MEAIRVVVRLRPSDSCENCIGIEKNTVSLKRTKDNRLESHSFAFDSVFGDDSTQEELFSNSQQLVNDSLNGYNSTIFAFGPTGSGKTYTMFGTTTSPGIVPQTIQHIFSSLTEKTNENKGLVAMVFLTYVELYNNTLYDLLSSDITETSSGLKIHERPTNGMVITGSRTIRTPISSCEEALGLISRASKHRATAATNCNERSSRSHTVITIESVLHDISTAGELSDTGALSSNSSLSKSRIGKINLVDLAGSERVKISGAEGQAFEEAKQINKALTVLGDCLNSLSKYYQHQKQAGANDATKLPHIPFRNSKLTMLLKDSLGGNAKTMMIATVHPSGMYYQQSMITLRYAARTKLICCTPVQNTLWDDLSSRDSVMRAMNEMTQLRSQLDSRTEEINKLKQHILDIEAQRQVMSESKHSASNDQHPHRNNSNNEASAENIEKLKQLQETEENYRHELTRLQQQSGIEKEHLQEKLKGIIHSHEGVLAEKQREYQHIEEQLQKQVANMQSLHRERAVALQYQRRAELSNQELHRKLIERQEEVTILTEENSVLSKRLALAEERVSAAEALVAASGIQKGDKEKFVDALQKLSISRNKYKSQAQTMQNTIENQRFRNEQQAAEIDRLSRLLSTEADGHIQATNHLHEKVRDQGDLMRAAIVRIQALESEALTRSETWQHERTMLEESIEHLEAQMNQIDEDVGCNKIDDTNESMTITPVNDDRCHVILGENDSFSEVADNCGTSQCSELQLMNCEDYWSLKHELYILKSMTAVHPWIEREQCDDEKSITEYNCDPEQDSFIYPALLLHSTQEAETQTTQTNSATIKNDYCSGQTHEDLDKIIDCSSNELLSILELPDVRDASSNTEQSELDVSMQINDFESFSLTHSPVLPTMPGRNNFSSGSRSLGLQININDGRSTELVDENEGMRICHSFTDLDNSNGNANDKVTDTAQLTSCQTPRRTENVFLRRKLTDVLDHEVAMYSTLELKLQDLNDAREKLLKLGSMIHENKFLGVCQICGSREDCSWVNNFDNANNNVQHILSSVYQEELAKARATNKEMGIQLNQKIRLLAMEQQATRDLTIEIEQLRISKDKELHSAISLMRDHLLASQERRQAELRNQLTS